MIKVPKIAAYVVLVALVGAAFYLVATAEGISSLLPWSQTQANPEPEPEGEQPPAGEPTTGDEVLDLDQESGRFFVEYRLERERVRSQEIDMLQQMISNPNVSAESKAEAEKKLLRLQELMEMELLVENALRAQAFDHAVLIVQAEGALVITDVQDLSAEQILLIAEITAQSTGLLNSQVKISNRLGK